MSSLFLYRRLYSLSTICRTEENLLVSNLGFLLHRFRFISSRHFSSVEEGKQCDVKQRRRSFVVSYLENSCGLSLASAELCSKYAKFKCSTNPDLVLCMLKKYGLTSEQITIAVKRFPGILSHNTEKILSPKLDFFLSIGFSEDDLAKVVSASPGILGYSLKNQLIPCYDFLKSVLGSDELVVKTLKRAPRIVFFDVQKRLARKVSLLQEAGVTDSCVAKLLERGPVTFCLKDASFEEAVKKTVSLGVHPSSLTFVPAFRAVIQVHQSTWDRKVELYKKWGWSDDDLRSAFNRQPSCMSISEKKIMLVMDFFVNKMGLRSSDVAKHPIAMLMSFERRVLPRCSVIAVLYSKGVLRKGPKSYFSVLSIRDETFFKRYVDPYQEHVFDLWNNLMKRKVVLEKEDELHGNLEP